MCLLCYIPENIEPDYYSLESSACMNPDGFGWAIHCGARIITHRSMDASEALETFERARRTNRGPALWHSRWTTHGTTSLDNCHPFRVGAGTVTWCEDIVPTMNLRRAMDDPARRARLEDWLRGSKLVVLTVESGFTSPAYIVNERLGHWRQGSWWSNDSYVLPKSWATVPDVREDDPCGACGALLSFDEVKFYGYCTTCGTCLDCGGDDLTCLCYSPASRLAGAE